MQKINEPTRAAQTVSETSSDGDELNTVESDELFHKQIAKRRYVVSELMPEGLLLLFGPPKVGKSFLVLNLCCAVAKGEPFLGYPTEKGEVLYFCFEDDEERLQKRLYGMTDDSFHDLFFSSKVLKIDEDLPDALEKFCREHPRLNLIVFDTFTHIRSDRPFGDVYKRDYKDLDPLQKFAMRHHLSILLVHHRNKNAESSGYDAISGSNGIAAACDDVYEIQRNSREKRDAKLIVSGRDVQAMTIEIVQDENGVWRPKNAPVIEKEKKDPVITAIFMAAAWSLDNCGCCEFTPTGFSETLKAVFGMDVLANMLTKIMTAKHEELAAYGISFKSVRTKTCRLLKFRKNDRFRYPYCVFNENGIVFDLIYNPEEYFGDGGDGVTADSPAGSILLSADAGGKGDG